MRRFGTAAWKFLIGNEGASVVEYALLLLLLATATIAGIAVLGGSISSAFQSFATTI
jgi:Flp pilus assembly pilin Flp